MQKDCLNQAIYVFRKPLRFAVFLIYTISARCLKQKQVFLQVNTKEDAAKCNYFAALSF